MEAKRVSASFGVVVNSSQFLFSKKLICAIIVI